MCGWKGSFMRKVYLLLSSLIRLCHQTGFGGEIFQESSFTKNINVEGILEQLKSWDSAYFLKKNIEYAHRSITIPWKQKVKTYAHKQEIAFFVNTYFGL